MQDLGLVIANATQPAFDVQHAAEVAKHHSLAPVA